VINQRINSVGSRFSVSKQESAIDGCNDTFPLRTHRLNSLKQLKAIAHANVKYILSIKS